MVNSFITTSAEDCKYHTGNLWVLVTSATNKPDTEKVTSPTLKQEDLHIDEFFHNASIDDLGKITKEYFPDQASVMSCIPDARSLSEDGDRTAMLVKLEFWPEYIDPNATSGLDSDANRKPMEGWQTLRVRWVEAAMTMDGLEELPVEDLNSSRKSRGEGFDGDVLQ